MYTNTDWCGGYDDADFSSSAMCCACGGGAAPSPSQCPPRAELRQQLVGHTSFPYSSSRTDTWDVLKEADADPAAAADVWLLYANRSTNGAQ
eukprot:scaffold42164_cov51-Phaeocystis_antarctica.AAC.1